MSHPNRTVQTFRFERWRAVSAGVMETAATTFLLVIAVRWFHAGAIAKGLIAAGGSVGLLLSPVVVTLVAKRGWQTSLASARVLAVGAACFALAAAVPVLPLFIVCSIVGMATTSMIIPLLTQMYQDNYPETERGRMFSRTVIIRIACAAVFSKLAGDALTGNLHHFRWLLLVFSLAMGFASFCISRCPARPLASDGSAHPLRGMRYAREDPLFRRTLICWMCLGIGNLMMLPLRVEYLANPKYGQMVSVENIALLTGVIPNVARLILSPIWGHVFDRMNFFGLRVTLNVGFAIGILTFFLSGTFTGLVIAAVVFGISNAGGDVAWSLWVTKFAPPERVADYMSVHTFLTGVRGVIAPMLAFYAINHFSLTTMAIFTTSLIIAGSLLLVPEIRFKPLRKGAALVEEVSD